MRLYGLDTNIFITAWWHIYPIDVFPNLWEQLSLKAEHIPILHPILTELRNGKEKNDVRFWMESQQFSIEPITSEINQEAIGMEARYQTGRSDKGVNSIDIQLVAWAKITGNTVVTFEKQPNHPLKPYNYKIPTICDKEGVRCILFVDFLRELSISL